ncbi:TetR/AcrR family transcriptional regulator [Paenibacillus alginolyticus]|uniref:TetR/AcrR family transcriptional regulator n=1 Tax=Paenibacillus alginolyticus TaxID=59839 RepID=A0ABT4GKJ5_9BACL|nr:TetR/AcrR family transcriptional regulator [Paenibacillus alginolyticus]MCY9669985.1 TetR/AcrR family transcriptional regulator [Paenibacillus alginolyticus]MCY9696724.1 TetR/AcrR family transcriptional regulator [Paenibacillus alginolyticus]MEC0147571.1 TetR/AcrR family transcriptional regulator [Paenibacillus alginolyticus]
MKVKKMDPRVVRTHQLLRRALIELMEERDFEQITVQDISERATVKRATFYLHFDDKQAFVQQYMNEILEDLREHLLVSEGSDPEEFDMLSGKAHPSFVRLFHQIAENFNLYYALLVRNRVPYFASALLEVIHEFISKGVDFTEPDDRNLTATREIVVKYVESAFLEVIIWWVANNMPYSEEEIAAHLMNLSIRGPYKHIPERKSRI